VNDFPADANAIKLMEKAKKLYDKRLLQEKLEQEKNKELINVQEEVKKDIAEAREKDRAITIS
jgi:hypothetical protein